MKDVDDEAIENNISAIQEAKSYICELAAKYGTLKENLSLQRVINEKRAKIWGILTGKDMIKPIEITNRIDS